MTRDIKHHLTDGLLLAYSAGTLPEAFSLVVATHISLCDDCRARLHAQDAVGGQIMEASGEAEVDIEDSFAAVLGRIEKADRKRLRLPRRPRRKVASDTSIFPDPLRSYVSGDLDAVRWRRIGGGVSQAVLPTGEEIGSAKLLKIPGGVAVPDHGHKGMELTLVLQGAFRDDEDRFAAGDIEIADEGLEHTPVAEEGEDCICLIATDAPLRFNSLIPRIAQRVLRI